MSNLNTEVSQGTQVEQDKPIPLTDCGQASKVTMGTMYHFIREGGWPPFDKILT